MVCPALCFQAYRILPLSHPWTPGMIWGSYLVALRTYSGLWAQESFLSRHRAWIQANYVQDKQSTCCTMSLTPKHFLNRWLGSKLIADLKFCKCFCLLLLLVHTQWCSGFSPVYILRKHSCWGLRNHVVCCRIKPRSSWAPYPLYLLFLQACRSFLTPQRKASQNPVILPTVGCSNNLRGWGEIGEHFLRSLSDYFLLFKIGM